MIKVEFTIEPFEMGEAPERVTRAVAAIEAMGISVEIGAFGSAFTTDSAQAGPAISALLAAAYAHGATHVTIGTEAVK